jgi:hypothetical protein
MEIAFFAHLNEKRQHSSNPGQNPGYPRWSFSWISWQQATMDSAKSFVTDEIEGEKSYLSALKNI